MPHATGYRERAWSGVGVPYRRGDSLGGGHGVFVFPYRITVVVLDVMS
jgi:hypothetical protein